MSNNLQEDVIDYLRGSCLSLHEALNTFEAEHLEEDDEFLENLDESIFQCTACGWWCPIDEEASALFNTDELTCRQCCEDEYYEQ